MHHASRLERHTASLFSVERFVRGIKPKVDSWETYPFHPSHLGLELSLAIGEGSLKSSHEAWETQPRHAFNTRGLGDIRGNTAYRFEFLCYCFSDAIASQGPRAGSPTLLLIHPPRLLLCARITNYGELRNLASGRREWAGAGNLFAKLLRTRYLRPLKVRSVLSAHCKRENGYLEQNRAENIKLEFSSYSQVPFV